MYRMYVDETGNADLAASADPVHRFLSLTGIVVERKHMAEVAIPEIQRIKHEILELDPDSMVPLHRKELMNREWPFTALRKPEKELAFNQAILKLLSDLDFKAITVVIDKQAHLIRYKSWALDPYHYCLRILFERYGMILNVRKAKGDVMSEARGKNEDARLALAYETIYSNPEPLEQEVVARCITSKKLKIQKKADNVIGLQIADLLAHPSALFARRTFNREPQLVGFAGEIVKILRRKYHRHSYLPIVRGYGLKWLP
jgi:hypothetical protein